jgi:hypothetical protein
LIACGDNQGLPHALRVAWKDPEGRSQARLQDLQTIEDKESMAHNIGGSVRHYRQPMDGDGIEVGG